ncbi:hypothetical protein [Bradyrhizobium sp. SZCCHNR3118]|uniref:hypothetical protein n=1 Tax=Bradyrhizobium sp. SZCCHNR3118 TaxID=3057468 RepID=UPI0029169275|nr:hypothetical protein [Bradyrhizobium sp. SZCCHNR3118]
MTKFFLCAAGGAGTALAIDASLRGMPVFAIAFAALALICLVGGWCECSDDLSLRSKVEDAEARASQCFEIARNRSAEAAHYLYTLIEARDHLAAGREDVALIEVSDAATDFERDPAVSAQLCVSWLTALRRQQIDGIGIAPIGNAAHRVDALS